MKQICAQPWEPEQGLEAINRKKNAREKKKHVEADWKGLGTQDNTIKISNIFDREGISDNLHPY